MIQIGELRITSFLISQVNAQPTAILDFCEMLSFRAGFLLVYFTIPFSRNLIVNTVNMLYIVCIIVVLASFFDAMRLMHEKWFHGLATNEHL